MEFRFQFVNRLLRAFFVIPLLCILSCQKESTSIQVDREGGNNGPGDLVARAAAIQLYEDYYLTSEWQVGDVDWTGNEPSCDQGNVPQATMDKILARLAYFRRAVGLNNTISLNGTKSAKAQAAALMMHANGALDHSPPSTWKCYTAEGKDGAGNSLLGTSINAQAIDTYIRDPGEDNGPVGHRRWLLWPNLQEIGIGNTSHANAIWVLGNAGAPPFDAPEFIAWPPKGYTPRQFIYPRWSFSVAGADFTNAQVSMTGPSGNIVPLALEAIDDTFGDNTIVWVPQGQHFNTTEDTPYTIIIENVGIDGQLKTYEYVTIVFDVNS
jgi:uncharacterized protein YkwD